MKLVGERVILRYPKVEDAEILFKSITHPDVRSNLERPELRDLTLEEEIKWVKNQAGLRRKKKEINFVILEKNTKKIVGVCGHHISKRHNNWSEIGFWIAKPYWKKGYATDTLRLLLKYGFKDLGFNRIEARCLTNNKGSIRVQEKCGLKREGLLRERSNYLGKPHDEYINSILKSEWENANNRN
ncbi:MAG: GNAT family N-acetyltransferase [Candidatus Woesearchaeota archaeon]|nr:MAG: GNAT family N-acetyltransferase [Candidatus Woesearchaeota archaeon]